MPDRCALYLPIRFHPTQEQLSQLDAAARVEASDDADAATVSWPGSERKLRLQPMPMEKVGEHLGGFVGYVRSRGGGEALVMRALQTMSVLGVAAEPDFGEDGRALKLLGAIASAGDGLWLLGEEIYDGGGRPLLSAEKGGLAAPSPERVAKRALSLLALAVRGLLEEDAGSANAAEAEKVRNELLERLGSLGVSGECEPAELKTLETPIGALKAQEATDAVWRAEGAQVLLWALGARGLPPHDQQEHPYRVARDSGLREGELPAALASPKLRPAGEVDAQRRQLTGIHWRLRDSPDALDLQSCAAKLWFGGFDLQGVPLVSGDLAVRGKAVFEAGESELALVNSIARERHQAANWLIGVHPVYSRVGTPT